MRRLLGLAVVALVAILIAALPAQATFPGKNGKLAFGSAQELRPEAFSTYSINPDGSDRSEVVYEGGMAAWSPDGKTLALRSFDYHSCCHPTSELEVVNADGSDLRLLSDLGGNVLSIAWSPDGTRIAISVLRYRRSTDIYVVNADGSGITKVVPDSEAVSWSPDGTKLLFKKDGHVHVSYSDGSGDVALTTGSPFYGQARWSPVGDQIAFAREGRIWMTRPDGSAQRPITMNLFAGDPVWSPAGNTLAFAGTDAGGKSNIYTATSDGSNLHNLTEEIDGYSSLPVWSPDGTAVAFQNGDYDAADIWTVDVVSGESTNLTRTPYRYELRDWQAIPGPNRSDFKNAAQFCKAEKAFWGEQFASRHGGAQNAFGKCMSSK
jgi:Tol biopolymer transport system component